MNTNPDSNTVQETPEQTIARLTAELAATKEILAGYLAKEKVASADESLIQEKMAVGLTREQAVSVIRLQRAHDAANA